jgi:outer membrane receptor protein involved in Fe transport
MSTAGQLFSQERNGLDPDSESLTGVELIYSAFPNDRLSFSLSGFYNDLEVIAFNADMNKTSLVGDLQLYGIEPEISYKWADGKISANYSYVKQIDWKLASGVPSSGISFSDYNQPLRNSNAVLRGVGNDLNNWPNHALKFFGRVTLYDRLTLHGDARFLWDFQGMKDGLEGLRRAVAGQPEEAAVLAAIKRVEDEGAYDYDFRANVSLAYAFRKGFDIQIFIQNLLGANQNKRYSLDSPGINRASPHRVRFIEEPRTLGIRMDYQF